MVYFKINPLHAQSSDSVICMPIAHMVVQNFTKMSMISYITLPSGRLLYSKLSSGSFALPLNLQNGLGCFKYRRLCIFLFL